MTPPIVHVKDEPNEVAHLFAKFLSEKITEQKELSIALSGGSTPALLFDILSKNYTYLDWERVHFYWGDERCVDPDSDESNFKMTREHLLNNISVPVQNIHRIMGENDPAKEAKRYSEELSNTLKIEDSLPIFDIIMLGMGTDGHTASIFPHEIELLNSTNFCEVATQPESGQKRITLTGKVINAAKNVCFLVTGQSKNEKVIEIFNKEGNWVKYPSSYIDPLNGKLHWFMDSAAAGGL